MPGRLVTYGSVDLVVPQNRVSDIITVVPQNRVSDIITHVTLNTINGVMIKFVV
jgi:hypothetical protein